MTTQQTIKILEKEKAKLIADIDKKIEFQRKKLEAENNKDFQSFNFKGKEVRSYKWENKKFQDFPMPDGFDWIEYFDFVEMINNETVELEKYPVYYYTKNQFKLNIKHGWSLSRLYLDGYLDLGSGNVNLDSSSGNGRVVVVAKN